MKIVNLQICEVTMHFANESHKYTLVKNYPTKTLSVWKDDVTQLDVPSKDCIGFINGLLETGKGDIEVV